MRSELLLAAVLGLSAVSGAMVGGCASRTEGERTLEQADRVEQAGILIRRGEMAVQDGRAIEARGQTLRTQGDTVEGDRLIAEGRAKQAQGEELIQQGRRMR
jgi:hypothetical protein